MSTTSPSSAPISCPDCGDTKDYGKVIHHCTGRTVGTMTIHPLQAPEEMEKLLAELEDSAKEDLATKYPDDCLLKYNARKKKGFVSFVRTLQSQLKGAKKALEEVRALKPNYDESDARVHELLSKYRELSKLCSTIAEQALSSLHHSPESVADPAKIVPARSCSACCKLVEQKQYGCSCDCHSPESI